MNAPEEELRQALKSLQAEHKALLQKNQDDLIRIRQQEAQWKVRSAATQKAMHDIESQRAQWAKAEADYQGEIEQLRRALEQQKGSQQVLVIPLRNPATKNRRSSSSCSRTMPKR